MNHIFFLIPLLIGVPFAYAESTATYDKEIIQINEDGTQKVKLTTFHPRILEDGVYENYLFEENDDYLRFESNAISFEFYKSTCDFKLYEEGKITGEPVIESYSTSIAINGVPKNIPVCNINNISLHPDGVDFEVSRGVATILYNLHYGGGAEWTYDVVGNGVITITEVCTNCVGEQVDEQVYKIGDYYIDTKDDIHGTFKEATQQGNDFHIKYEADSIDGRLIIDPTVTNSNGGVALATGDHDNDNNGIYIATTDSTIYGLEISEVHFWLKKLGTPTGTATIGLWTDTNSGGTKTLAHTFGTIDVATLTTGLIEYTFDTGSYTTSLYDTIGLQFAGGDGSNNPQIEGTNTDTYDSTDTGRGRYTVGAWAPDTFRDIKFTIIYSAIPDPDSVQDLTTTDISDITVDLDWSTPNLNTGNLTGYQVNYTTPWSDDPDTIITNNTESSDTDSDVTGLTELTQYSFRIGVWTEGSNMTGNVLNITTVEDFTQANFTPGFFDLNATNPDVIQMYFERTDTNSTSLILDVIYPTAYDLACDFSYEFANINQTYSSLVRAGTTHSGIDSAVESSFEFNGVDNEIIDVYCWDQNNSENDGQYIITQTMFPLLQQIADFRAGEFGTSGGFGALDIITLFVIMISMIGFNRVNESVGVVFNIILLGSLAFFNIIELSTLMFGMLAVVIMVVIGTTRKK